MNNTANPGMPIGDDGRVMLERMNGGDHAELAAWGLEYFHTKIDADILEIGCGGGANIARLLNRFPKSKVTGADYSELSVQVSSETNSKAIASGRVTVKRENVSSLSFSDKSFDAATAFETIYFWPGLAECFGQVFRVLKDGGIFFICNETDGDAPEGYEWEKENDNMKIYKINEISDCLYKAGFSNVSTVRKEENGWVCFIAIK
jgi:ubiquinone/menaquinone biosynthesis C-methylase UbiE